MFLWGVVRDHLLGHVLERPELAVTWASNSRLHQVAILAWRCWAWPKDRAPLKPPYRLPRPIYFASRSGGT